MKGIGSYKTYQGLYRPENPEKYMGNVEHVVYRSGWELQVFRRLDVDPSVAKWASEEFSVAYFNPIDQKIHRYFPDLYIENVNGTKIVLEIKPEKFTKAPAVPKRQTKRFLQEAATFMINKAKWASCEMYCEERGWQFIIGTEKNLGIVI